jgi:hypothetical protein
MDLSLQQRRSRITTLTYTFVNPDTDAECTAAWYGPLESALARGVEVLGAKRCDDGRFAWYAQETGEAYLSPAETVAELGAAYIDLPGEQARAGATSLYSLWCAGDFDSEAIDRRRCLRGGRRAHRRGGGVMSEDALDLIRRLAAGDETAVDEPAQALAAEDDDLETAAWALQKMRGGRCLLRRDLGPVPGWRITHFWSWAYDRGAICYDQHIELLVAAGVERGDSLGDIERRIVEFAELLS